MDVQSIYNITFSTIIQTILRITWCAIIHSIMRTNINKITFVSLIVEPYRISSQQKLDHGRYGCSRY